MPLKRGQRYSLPKLSSAAHILTLLVLLNWILLGVSGAGAALLQDDKRAVDHPVFTQKKCFVYTDHKPLVVFTPNTPSRFVRWSLLVQDFQERQRECDGRRALLVFWKTSVLWLLLHFLQFSKLFLFFNSLCTGVTPLALRIFECTCGSTSGHFKSPGSILDR